MKLPEPIKKDLLLKIIKKSPVPDFKEFIMETIGLHSWILSYNEDVDIRQFAEKFAKVFSMEEPKNHVHYSALMYAPETIRIKRSLSKTVVTIVNFNEEVYGK